MFSKAPAAGRSCLGGLLLFATMYFRFAMTTFPNGAVESEVSASNICLEHVTVWIQTDINKRHRGTQHHQNSAANWSSQLGVLPASFGFWDSPAKGVNMTEMKRVTAWGIEQISKTLVMALNVVQIFLIHQIYVHNIYIYII